VPTSPLEELLFGTAFDPGSVVLVEDGVPEEVQIAGSKPTNERTIGLPSLNTQTDNQMLSEADRGLISIIREQFPSHVQFYRECLTPSEPIENVKPPLHLYTEGLGRLNSISDRPPSVEFTAEQQLELIKLFQRTSLARECLRAYQIETFESIISFLEDENRHSGFVRVPTGFGKTVLFALASAAYDQKTLVLVPTLQLAEQTKDRFNQFCPDINVGIICDGKNSYNNNCSVLITTYATFNSDQRAIENSDTNSVAVGKIDWSEFKLVILDEAHQTGIASEHGDNEAVTLSRLRNFPAEKKLGFSATPYFGPDGRDLRRLLPDIVFNLTLRQLFERVDASSIVCPIEKYEKLVVLCSPAERKLPEYTSWIVDRWKNNYSNRASLLYCSSIEEAQALAKAFQERGVQAHSVTSKDSNTAESLEAFRRGDVSVLISVQQLTTGTDLPRADHIWVLHPLTSAVTLEQIVGRGLRLNPDNPEKALLVSMNYHDPSKGVTLGDVIWANHFDTEERYFSRSNRPGCFLGENNKVNSPRRAGGGHTHWFNCSTLVGDTQSSEHLKDGCITLSQLVADLSENEQGMNEVWLPEAAVEAYAQDSGPGNYYYREVAGRRSIYEIALSQELASYIRQKLTNQSSRTPLTRGTSHTT
jgi:superfamily II DNA or RNA helicase